MSVFKLSGSLCDDISCIIRHFWWGGTNEASKIHWLAWNKLCRPKKDGGLGFRDFESFNAALLGKQAWRIATNPNSLVAKVLGARYFPKCNFLEAPKGFQPSYTWQSILHGRDLLLKGLAWEIGDGRMAKIWGDCWLPNDQVLRRVDLGEFRGNEKVEMLIEGSTRSWKVEDVKNLFEEEVANIVLSLRLSPEHSIDRCQWRFTKDGNYYVRSAYHLATQTAKHAPSSSSGTVDKFWNKIWHIRAHPRIRMLLWRIAWCIVLTKGNLRHRKLDIEECCPSCKKDIETLGHMLTECPLAQQVWHFASFHKDICIKGVFSARNWLEQVFELLKPDDLPLFAYCCDEIWKMRNQVCFNRRSFDAESVWVRGLKASSSFEEVFNQKQQKGNAQQHNTTWQPPDCGAVKINFNAAVNVEGMRVGIAAIARDHLGGFVCAAARAINTNWPVALAEAETCLLATKLGQQFPNQRLIFEGDAQILVHQIRGSIDRRGAERGVVDTIKGWFESRGEASIQWVHRMGNEAVDRLAKSACYNDLYGEWGDHPPDILTDVLL